MEIKRKGLLTPTKLEEAMGLILTNMVAISSFALRELNRAKLGCYVDIR